MPRRRRVYPRTRASPRSTLDESTRDAAPARVGLHVYSLELTDVGVDGVKCHAAERIIAGPRDPDPALGGDVRRRQRVQHTFDERRFGTGWVRDQVRTDQRSCGLEGRRVIIHAADVECFLDLHAVVGCEL